MERKGRNDELTPKVVQIGLCHPCTSAKKWKKRREINGGRTGVREEGHSLGLTDIYNVMADVREKATGTSDLLTEEERFQATGTPHRTTALERGHTLTSPPQSVENHPLSEFLFCGRSSRH